MSDEKTEEPTDKKLRDAREKGESVKSPDLSASLQMIVSTILLVMSSFLAGDHLEAVFNLITVRCWTARSPDDTLAIMFEVFKEYLLMTLPYVLSAVLMGLIAGFSQVGMQISFEPLTPNFDKVNPGSGIKKLFSVRSIIDFGKMVLKAVALGSVLYVIIKGLFPLLVGSALQQPMLIVKIAWSALTKLVGAATIVFLVLGPLDYAIQAWLFKRDQRMSKDEVKREHKEQEGDPEIKGKRKQLARELANSPPQKRMPNANVVVTNPTHYAVALQYQPGVTPVPVVIAKGHDAEAAVIRELAAQHKVPIVSNPPLARALYKVPLDEPVPEALFEAVAAVLRWVQIIGQLSGGLRGAMPGAGPAALPPSTD
jgi:type III secretion protein U